MALQKVDYVNQVTVITAENMNNIQDSIIALENAPTQGLSEDVKQALLQLAQKVAYIDDQGQTYYDDLYDALYPPRSLDSIDAVFNQGSAVIYDTASLNSLKQYLTVTANYSDGTREMLSDSAYTLSGTLTVGTSTVTASYQGKTDTFAVTVTEAPVLDSITAVYTQSGTVYNTDSLDSLKDDLVVTANYADSSTQTVPAADYVLSGTLTVGTSTITVSYGGKTTTFTVTVTRENLPSEYQEVEYVEVLTTSTAGPYFRTGYRPVRTGNLVLEVDCMASGVLTKGQYPIGVASSASATGFAIAFSSNGTDAFAYNGESTAITLVDSGTYAGNRYYFTAVGNLSGYESITCGNLSSTNTTASPHTYGADSYCVVSLFGVQKGNSTNQIFTGLAGKIYYAKITEDNVVRRQMIPCYRKSDNAPGFYDMVTQAFIGHTGDVSQITVGPNV